MHRFTSRVLLVGAIFLAALQMPALANHVTIDFSASHNGRIQDRNPAYPEGDVVLGGVPFSIPVGGNNEWRTVLLGTGQNILDVNVGLFGVARAYLLVDNDWGVAQSGKMLVDFFGSDGAHLQLDLIGNSDIRDWNLFFTNQINGVTTVNVVTIDPGVDGNPDVMDMLIVDLPSDFLDETLDLIRVTDNCAIGSHCGLVSGITVEAPVAFPVSSTLSILAVGLLLLGTLAWAVARMRRMGSVS